MESFVCFLPVFLTYSFQLDYNLDVVPLPVRRALAQRSKATVSPSHQCQDTAATGSCAATPMPVPSKCAPIDPAHSSSNTSAPTKSNSQLQAMPKAQSSNTGTAKANAPLQAASSNSGWGSPVWTPYSLIVISPPSPTGFDVSFPPDPTSPLHRKPGTFRFGPPVPTAGSKVFTQPSSSQLLMVDGTSFLIDYPMPC